MATSAGRSLMCSFGQCLAILDRFRTDFDPNRSISGTVVAKLSRLGFGFQYTKYRPELSKFRKYEPYLGCSRKQRKLRVENWSMWPRPWEAIWDVW